MIARAEVFTDGSCHTQHCIGAWASLIFINGHKVTLSGIEKDTTHNRMEILAVINALEFIKEKHNTVTEITIVSDSQYVIGLISREKKFIALNYKTKAGKEIRNIDLVQRLLKLNTELPLEFVKIKAHQKQDLETNYNIEVDKLCRNLVREAIR